jgi:hypothetical protein
MIKPKAVGADSGFLNHRLVHDHSHILQRPVDVFLKGQRRNGESV